MNATHATVMQSTAASTRAAHAPANKRGDISVDIQDVMKSYGDFVAVNNISLKVKEGEFLTLLGPSGSGKTTTLQMIAGFETPDAGDVRIRGRSMRGVPPHQRNLGMVFQSYSLFPHMSVFDNVAFPLRIRRDRERLQERVHETLALVHLQDFVQRKPHELSGGQRQRVALARAFVYQPDLLLMDEPLSALDKNLREQLQRELRHIHRTLGTTIIFVTHDQEEAMRLSDRIAVFDKGRIMQCGTAHELYHEPQSEFVASFLGNGNIFAGKVVATDNGVPQVATDEGEARVAAGSIAETLRVGDTAKVFVRPEYMHVKPAAASTEATQANIVHGTVSEHVFCGDKAYIVVATQKGKEIRITRGTTNSDSWQDIAVGTPVNVSWDPVHGRAFHGSTNKQ